VSFEPRRSTSSAIDLESATGSRTGILASVPLTSHAGTPAGRLQGWENSRKMAGKCQGNGVFAPKPAGDTAVVGIKGG
jgi:hypothetical protein